MSTPSVKPIPWLVVMAYLCLCVAGTAWAKPPQADTLKSALPAVRSSPILLPAIDALENGVPLETSMAARTLAPAFPGVKTAPTRLM